jgi:arsenite-transporting ATPase
VTDDPGPIRGGPPNLSVRELDAQRALQQLRGRLADAIEGLFARLTGSGGLEAGLDAGLAVHDRRVIHDLIDLAPPGIDELVAMIEVLAALDASPDEETLLVIDTAPTGHALRLIEMPALVHDWVKALMAILLKYQPVVGVGELGAVLLRLSQGLGRLRALMADPVRTRFIAVTRAAVLPRAETVRLLKRLGAAGVSAPLVVVNAAGAGTCRRCRVDVATQATEIAALQRQTATRGNGPATLVARAEMPPPHGPRRLGEWQTTWRAVTVAGARPSRAAAGSRGRR